ncbi:unnamed protein product [Rotaria magnacalcarata]|uniref:Uncharacterized protein n=2 Tax=Rotaria magnacalcarata TaxID=392030 RepID=A0A816CT99_9BILA|nr:unnamed protein product [Rotaria magnacalcarata]CAF1632094.1 unnamed protein product [Rotaria magnacalcarata]CAF2058362.1 unnamed protein product [Rotaria magnacalcarata]CAF2271128.1 unnamed protein product [Rotaria magnacalcarata]CAF3928205.1 unnamed protein product [Rotaria magnacalcarata]
MQYAQDNEKFVAMGSPYMPVSQLLSLTDDPEIRRTRKNLRILLGVLLVLAVLGTISSIAGVGITNNSKYSSRGAEISQSIISVVFLSFGYLVVHRYSNIGLRVFAWLNIIDLVIVGIALAILVICGLVVVSTTSSVVDAEQKGILVGLSMVVIIAIILIIAGFILQIIIVKLAFKLARLIEAKKSLFFSTNITV